MANKNHSNGSREIATMRRYRILQATLAGASERQIAEQEGVARSLVHRDKKKVLEDLAKAHEGLADEVRSVQMERYNQLLLRHWQNAMSGDGRATDLVLRIMKEINVICGVIPDKPMFTLNQNSVFMNQSPVTFRIETYDDSDSSTDVSETKAVSQAGTGDILSH